MLDSLPILSPFYFWPNKLPNETPEKSDNYWHAVSSPVLMLVYMWTEVLRDSTWTEGKKSVKLREKPKEMEKEKINVTVLSSAAK